jgi:hypothetical protein
VLSAVDLGRPDAFPLPDLMAATTLDAAQARAVAACLTRELALVQGPPGTGRSARAVGVRRQAASPASASGHAAIASLPPTVQLCCLH